LTGRYAVLLSVLTAVTLGPGQQDQGGPDGFGYYFESTQDPTDTIHFFWLDPTGHEPITNWTPNPDDGWARIPLPYRFPFYGDTLDSVIVCTNGFLEFPVTFSSYLNQPLPAQSFPSLIALFWDDLCPNRSGSVRVHNNGTERFTSITWHNVIRFNTSETLSCQLLLYADGQIRMNYFRIPATANSNTIGIQGHSGQSGHYLQYVCDGEPEHHLPEDSTAIRFFVRRLTHDVGTYRVVTPQGWIPANSQCPVSAIFKNYGLTTENFPVHSWIVRTRLPYDTLFYSTTTVPDLEPGDTIVCYFGDFLTGPSPDSWFVQFRSDLANDMYRRNDTCRVSASSFPPRFGTPLASWNFPELGDGMNLSGITYRSDSNRFYVAVNESSHIISFPARGPDSGLRTEPFQLQNFFGDDWVWGIAWDDAEPGFWLTHISAHGSGCILARYHPDGTFTGDTWGLAEIEPGVWFAGIDQGPDNQLFATAVGGHNRIYCLDPRTKSVAWFLNGPTASYRACCYLGDHNAYLLSGGWNDNNLVKLDITGNIVQSAYLPDLADLDVYHPARPFPDSIVWAYLTKNNYENTIQQVSIGTVWANIGLADHLPDDRPLPSFVTLPNPTRGNSVPVRLGPIPANAHLSLWDATGRLLNSVTLSQPIRANTTITLPLTDTKGRYLPAGIYLLRLATGKRTYTTKLVLATRR